MKIIVDAMGGDNAPRETTLGAFAAARELDPSIEYTLVGDENAIREIAAAEGVDLARFEIVATTEVITMEDDPVCVMRAKKESSMSTGLRMLAEGKGDDSIFEEFMRTRHPDEIVYNLRPNLVQHVDDLLGGSVVNKDRDFPIRAKYWTDDGEMDDLQRWLERRKSE